MSEGAARGRIPRLVWWLPAAWVLVTVAAVLWGVPHQERHLRERATEALRDQAVAVDFAGRDAMLTGEVGAAADLDRAVATVRPLRGVRRVDAGDVVIAPGDDAAAPDAAAVPTPPGITVEVRDGAATLSGTLPTQATADAVHEAAEAKWGAGNVVDRMVVGDDTAGAAWLAGIVPAIVALDELHTGSLTVGPAGALIAGTVASADAAGSIEERLVAAFAPDTPIENRLEVLALADPSFAAELLADGSVRLRGVMPDQASVDAVVAAAGGVYGSAAVVNEMTVGEDVAAPDYVAVLPGVFGAVDGLNPWLVTVEEGKLLLSGLAVSEDAIASTESRLEVVFAQAGLTVDNQAQVDPTAVASVLTELLRGTATFQVGSSRLSDEAGVLLDEAIAILSQNSTTVVTVEGHTDDVGSEDANLALSEARAEAVVDYLVAGGIDAARLTAIGYGESRPIADNTTAEGRAQNRRIEFVVEEGENQ